MRQTSERKKDRSFRQRCYYCAIDKLINDTEVITMRKVRHVLSNDYDIDISKVPLWRQLRSLIFTSKKLKISAISGLRAKYLRKLKEVREEGYEIHCLYESHINAHHVFDKE